MTFAGVLMVVGGIVSVFSDISAIADDDVCVATRNCIFGLSPTGWAGST
ncbi:hypothetical protein ACIQ7Q_01125 [Streptomyces sp. NPDC096176]